MDLPLLSSDRDTLSFLCMAQTYPSQSESFLHAMEGLIHFRSSRIMIAEGNNHQGCSQGALFTEALAEFQHVNCMIVQI